MRLPNAVLLAAIALPTTASAATLDVPGTYPTVAAAVAASAAGDEIVVDSSAYVVETAPIVVTTSLTIRSTGGSASTELPALHVDGGELVLSGFTIEIRDPAVISTHGQAALFVDAGTLVGDDLVFVPQAWPFYSFGLLSQFGDVTLTKVAADGFTAIAPLWFENSTFDVTSATLTNNSDEYGGYSGALLSNTSVGTVDSSTFTGNVGPQTGAVFSMFGDLTVTNSTFEDNNGPWGGAMLLGDGVITIEDSTFTDNVADEYAGDIWVGYETDLAVIGSTFSGSQGANFGGAIYVTNTGEATVTDSTVTATYAAEGGAFAQDATGALTLDGVTIDTTSASFGGAAATQGGPLTIRDSDVLGITAGSCAAIYTFATTTITDSYFYDISASRQGGAICGFYNTIDISGSEFDTISSGFEGAVGELHNVTMTVTDTTITNTSTVGSGGVFWTNGVTLLLDGVTQSLSKARDGGVIGDDGKLASLITVRDSRFTDNIVTNKGGFYYGALAGGELELVRNRFCHNTANVGAVVASNTVLDARNNVFFENTDVKGGTISAVAVTSVVNNTFIGNVTPLGVVYGDTTTETTLTNNIIQGSAVGIGYVAAPIVTPVGGYDLWWDNTADADAVASAYFPTATAIFADPAYRAYTAGDCDSDLNLTITSPANNTGDPSILNPDGTRSDVGAYGGPDAIIPDGDGDGSPIDEDCNDADATVYPGAVEIPYDGIDQDCDGEDECDVDGDGYDAIACGGDDCDDMNEGVNPGTPEIPYDGIDQDCSGDDDCDLDGDGHDAVECKGGDDCSDKDDTIHPGATEIPYDGIDQDCDGEDECDVDGDGYDALECPEGNDCDDDASGVNPGAAEIPYDGIDQDCDGEDECDVDGDGFDDEACPDGEDCADDDAAVNPDATDIPDDGIDQDCDGADATVGDTDPQDTDPVDTDEGETWVQGGCDCSVEGGSPANFAWLGALALLGITRRRRA